MLINNIKRSLQKCEEDYSLRQRVPIEKREGNQITVTGKHCINFASNDYLGIAVHKKAKRAYLQGVRQYGIGSSSSAIVNGYYKHTELLEERFAKFLGHDRAVFFNSGYHANLGVITAFSERYSTIFSDKLCHASLLDGIQLSRAKHFRYRHTDITHLQHLLEKATRHSFIVTESVFSMEGSIVPLTEIAALSKCYRVPLIVDEAHGIGVMGSKGAGVGQSMALTQEDIFCTITPLGKAFGSAGAMVSGKNEVIEYLIQNARTYRYSTALPPALSVALLEILKIIETETWRREKLQENIRYFIEMARVRQLPLVSDHPTPIKSILIGDPKRCLIIQQLLLERGIFVACIRPPTVPHNTSRIRISLNCLHSKSDIIHLLDNVTELYEIASADTFD